jgi:hypothetical protein
MPKGLTNAEKAYLNTFNSGPARTARTSNRSSNAAKLLRNAEIHWYSNGYLEKPNKTYHYRFIRNSPVIEFKTNANVINMLKRLGHGNKNSNYYKGRATYAGAIFKQTPKHRKLYIMNVEPFRLAYGEKGINSVPGMVKAWNQRRGIQRREGNRLALVNKALMNRYLHQRSLTKLANEKYSLKNAAKLIKVAGILNKGIQRKRQVVRNAAEKWRFQASMQAARKRFLGR